MSGKIFLSLLIALGLLVKVAIHDVAAGEFYKGKTLRVIVMTTPGGGYDTYTRAIVRHFSKHIPGKPSIIVQNMPGAGGFIATNYVYNIAKPDGLTVLVTNSGVVLQQAVGMSGIRFDARKFGWIGTPGSAIPVCAIMGFTGLKTLKDVMNVKKPLNFGAAGTSTYQQPMILKLVVGANIKVIQGYRGTSGIRAAMQRKEVDGACWQWASMRSTAREMLDAEGDDKLIPFIIEGKVSDPEVKDLPQFSEVIKDKENLATFNAWIGQYKFYTPFLLPPKTPKKQLDILRKAFKRTILEQKFRALAKRLRLDLSYVSGEAAEKLVSDTLSISSSVQEKLRPLIFR